MRYSEFRGNFQKWRQFSQCVYIQSFRVTKIYSHKKATKKLRRKQRRSFLIIPTHGSKLHENQTNMPKGCHKVRGLILRHLSIYVDMLRGDGSWRGYSG